MVSTASHSLSPQVRWRLMGGSSILLVCPWSSPLFLDLLGLHQVGQTQPRCYILGTVWLIQDVSSCSQAPVACCWCAHISCCLSGVKWLKGRCFHITCDSGDDWCNLLLFFLVMKQWWIIWTFWEDDIISSSMKCKGFIPNSRATFPGCRNSKLLLVIELKWVEGRLYSLEATDFLLICVKGFGPTPWFLSVLGAIEYLNYSSISISTVFYHGCSTKECLLNLPHTLQYTGWLAGQVILAGVICPSCVTTSNDAPEPPGTSTSICNMTQV